MTDSATGRLAAFAAGLRFEDIPEPVIRRTEDLFADWLGSAVAGSMCSGRWRFGHAGWTEFELLP